MAFEQNLVIDGTVVAGSNLSDNQFNLVKITGEQTVDVSAVAGEVVYGVLQNNPVMGAAAAVAIAGGTKVKAHAAIAAGARVASNGDGTIKAAVSGNYAIGTLKTAATAANDIVTMVLGVGTGLLA